MHLVIQECMKNCWIMCSIRYAQADENKINMIQNVFMTLSKINLLLFFWLVLLPQLRVL